MELEKDKMIELIKNQPDDSTYDEILRELAFNQMIKRGINDSEQEKTISNEEMGKRIKTWSK